MMAEVVGIASGAITFATVVVQVGKSITTLKDCWDQLNDAPDDFRKLVREIELFGLILADIEDDLSRDTAFIALNNSKHMIKCITLCKEAAKDLDEVCTEIIRDTKLPGRLRWPHKSVKMVMQKGKVEKHVARLQKVIQLLMLSQQCYTQALIRFQPKLIVERIEQHKSNCSKSGTPKAVATSEESCTTQTTLSALQRKSRGFAQDSSYRWRLSLPHWMTSKVFEIAGMKAPSGWNWMLRVYSVVQYRSRAVACLLIGNIQELQDLFASGKASPFDHVEDTGLPLLHWVGRSNRTEVIEFLLSQGADPNSSLYIPVGSRVSKISCAGSTTEEMPSLIPSMRVLFQHININYETAEDAVEYALNGFYGTPKEFIFLQQYVCPFSYQLPKWARVKLALRVLTNPSTDHFVPELIRTIIGMDDLEADNISESHSFGFTRLTLIHSVVFTMGVCQRHLEISDRTQEMRSTCDSWCDLCHEFLSLGVDIHGIVDGKSLFLAFLEGYFLKSTLFHFQNGNVVCNAAIQVWLGNLEAAGIDLARYGEVEECNWKDGITGREFSGWNIAEQAIDTQRVIGFAYGPSSEDWHMWLSEASDPFVGEFWEMIERPVEVIPGAWPEG